VKIPLISKILEKRTQTFQQKLRDWLSGVGWLWGGESKSGVMVSEYNALQVTGVYACVRILAETVASLPLPLYRRLDRGKDKAVNHPLYSLLHDMPNPDMTSFTFRETMMGHLLLFGNAYAQIIRGERTGKIIELWPLYPDRMTVDRNIYTGKLEYKYSDGVCIRNLTPEQVLHIPGLGFDGIRGYSPIYMAREAIGLCLATEEYGARFFGNGARPGGVLEHPGTIKDPKKLRESWEDVYKGAGNAHKICVLEEGMSYKQIGIPPEDAQFLETRKFQLGMNEKYPLKFLKNPLVLRIL
jgi:HK97 family phage portal protein